MHTLADLVQLQAALVQLLPGELRMSADNLDLMKVVNVATGQLPSLGALSIGLSSPAMVASQYLRPACDCARPDALRIHRRC